MNTIPRSVRLPAVWSWPNWESAKATRFSNSSRLWLDGPPEGRARTDQNFATNASRSAAIDSPAHSRFSSAVISCLTAPSAQVASTGAGGEAGTNVAYVVAIEFEVGRFAISARASSNAANTLAG
jgi:hypothetical protein